MLSSSSRNALDRFDPDRGVDFPGFLSQRLRWGLAGGAEVSPACEVALPEAIAASAADGEDPILATVAVGRTLARLPAADADLVRARYFEGYFPAELARALGCS